MRSGKYLIVLVVLFFNTTLLRANYAFYRQVTVTCKHYHITVKAGDMYFSGLGENKPVFHLNLNSRRNNFEAVLIAGFVSAGRAIQHQHQLAEKRPDYRALIPDQVEVVVTIPLSRDNAIISARATADQIGLLTEGKINTTEFMRRIKDSITTL